MSNLLRLYGLAFLLLGSSLVIKQSTVVSLDRISSITSFLDIFILISGVALVLVGATVAAVPDRFDEIMEPSAIGTIIVWLFVIVTVTLLFLDDLL